MGERPFFLEAGRLGVIILAMAGTKKNSHMAGAAAFSVVAHLALVALAGAGISAPAPKLAKIEVDLRIASPLPAAVPSAPLPEEVTPAPALESVPAPQPAVRKKQRRPQPKPAEPRPAPVEAAPEPSLSPPPEPAPAGEQAGLMDSPRPAPAADLDRIASQYNRLLVARISRAKRYPLESRRTGEEGTVKIRFVVLADGGVTGIEVATSSGHERLDRAAMEAVERAAPFPPIPDELGSDRVVRTVPIEFTLR